MQKLWIPLLSLPLWIACSNNTESKGTDVTRPSGWSEASHGSDAAPGYARVFLADSVHSLKLTLTQAAWDSMKADLALECGAFGSGAATCSSGDMLDMVGKQPLWVECTLEQGGTTWTHVGVRLKGNSSLTQSWAAGSKKLPFRLSMDKFESEYPEIEDQRYWGFQKLSLFNNSGDATGLREKIAAELFNDAGVAAPRSALVRITFVHGDSTEELGMYTMAEIPDQPMLTESFGNATGNLYKPTSTLASYADSDFFDEDESGDASDVQKLISTLNDPQRLGSPSVWRAKLDSVFATGSFLRWLAVNTVISNWDAYGQMAHNYYLYNNSGKLTWIPWDLGLSFSANGGMGGGALPDSSQGFPPGMDSTGFPPGMDSTGFPPGMDSNMVLDSGFGGGGGMGSLGNSIWFDKLDSTQWPLIVYLMKDSVYRSEYIADLQEVIAGPLSAANVQAKVDKYGALVAPFADSATFGTALQTLRDFMPARLDTIQSYLNQDPYQALP